MKKETWKIVKGYPAYRISSRGVLQSRWYMGKKDKRNFKDIWKTIKIHRDKKGYMRAHLSDGINKSVGILIHVLVAENFLGQRPFKKACVRHLDSNPFNNNVNNLAWGSYWENEQDKLLNGTWDKRNGGAKLNVKQVLEIRNKWKQKYRQEDLAKEYGVSRPTITRIVNRTIWKNEP